jgi:hypothetical protein
MVRTLVANALREIRGDDVRGKRRQLARQPTLLPVGMATD